MTDDRRHHRRLNAPVLWRVSGLRSIGAPVDVSIGGIRMFSDDPLEVGARLELELLVPGEEKVEAIVRVVWIEALPEGSPAHYDVGFEFLQVSEAAAAHLRALLGE